MAIRPEKKGEIMYYQVKGCKGRVKLDTKFAWEMIRQIIESGQETLLKRSFRLSI